MVIRTTAVEMHAVQMQDMMKKRIKGREYNLPTRKSKKGGE